MIRRVVVCALAALPALAQDREGIEFFEKKIRPVLASRCYGCHGPASKTPMGGLLADSRDGLLRGGASGRAAVIPKKPADSLLLAAIRHTGALKMPPGQRLPDDTVADFEQWIRMGAPDPREAKTAAAPPPPPYDFEKARRHWSFQPVRDPEPPRVSDPLWGKTPIDRFVKASLDARKLAPVGLAGKRALVRRATFDLTGLPPTPEEVEAFLKDSSPDAFEKLVDRLLASPRYGERWGRHWLDVVRYADTAGCNSDFPVPDAWRYRNWVIDAFRSDKPYPDFLREQLAGDLLPAANAEDRAAKTVATGYLAISRRFASSKNEHHLTIDDTVDNVGKGMLGLSVSCARCHDHKFDPIPQRDYFGLYGIFDSTVYPFPGVETVPRPHDFVALDPARQKTVTAWEDRIKDAYARIRELRFGAKRLEPGSRAEIERIKNEVLALELAPPGVPKAYAVKEGPGHNARIHFKGNPSPKTLGAEAPRGWLTVLGGEKLPPGEKSSGRARLAEWIADPRNPLTARVMVNRIWQGHFGKGLVATPNDFGVRGEPPTHPELLDWLAARFAESGWSVKRMHRLIMLSRAYRLASDHSPAAFHADPKNQYLWRFDRRRLEAEEIRDAMLAVAGKLDPTPGGPHPFPALHTWSYSQHRQFFAQYDTDRRSVYLLQQRLRKHPLLELFDAADPNASTGLRPSSVTALQALALMNSEFVHAQADAFAVRVGMAHPETPARIRYACEIAFGRPPSPAEAVQGAAYLRQAQAALADSNLAPESRPRAALASYLRVLLASDEFFFVD